MMRHEHLQLDLCEIMAVVSLAGKDSLIGFSDTDRETITQEMLCDAICKMMNDNLMTQIDGTIRMSKDMVDVMYPIVNARHVLSLVPSDDHIPPLLLYVAQQQIVALKPNAYGSFLLCAITPEEIESIVEEHLDLTFPELVPNEEEAAFEITVCAQTPHEELLRGAQFVLECFDADTAQRAMWIRVEERGVFSWLQWTQDEQVVCEPLTKQGWQSMFSEWIKGVG